MNPIKQLFVVTIRRTSEWPWASRAQKWPRELPRLGDLRDLIKDLFEQWEITINGGFL